MSTSTFARWSFVLVLSACLLPATAMGAYVRDQYQLDSNQSTDIAAQQHYIGQTFTPSMTDGWPLAYIRVDLSYTGDLYMDLYDTDGSGAPDNLLDSSSAGTVEGGWDKFDFGAVSLDEGEVYAFALRSDSAYEHIVSYQWWNHATTDKYSGGTIGTLSGGTWYPGVGAWAGDLKFETYHTPEPTAMVGLLSMGSLALVYSGLRRRARKRAAR